MSAWRISLDTPSAFGYAFPVVAKSATGFGDPISVTGGCRRCFPSGIVVSGARLLSIWAAVREAFGITVPTLAELALVSTVGLLVFVLIEATKFVLRKRK